MVCLYITNKYTINSDAADCNYSSVDFNVSRQSTLRAQKCQCGGVIHVTALSLDKYTIYTRYNTMNSTEEWLKTNTPQQIPYGKSGRSKQVTHRIVPKNTPVKFNTPEWNEIKRLWDEKEKRWNNVDVGTNDE